MSGFAAAWSVKRRPELNRLPELDLSGRDLAHASAVEARLVGARLEQADLSGTRLVSAQLEGAILIAADLEDAEAWYASFDRANLTGARLARANLTSSSLEGAALPGAVLSGASLTEAELADADLAEAQLVGADLSRASLRRAELRDASLNGAVLDGADLSGARNLTQDQLAHAVGDADTLLPAGLRVKGCWPKLPARARALVDLGTLPEGVADVLEAHVCAKGVKPALFPPAPLAYPTEPRPEDRQAARESVAREAAEDKRRILALTAAPGASPAGLMPRPRPAGQPLRLAGR